MYCTVILKKEGRGELAMDQNPTKNGFKSDYGFNFILVFSSITQ